MMESRSTAERAGGAQERAVDVSGALALGVALACVLAYSRAFVSGFGGLSQAGQDDLAGMLPFACSLARFLALAGITVLGARGRRFASAVSLRACGLVMVLGALAIFAGASGGIALAAAAVAGVASGFALFATLLFLAAKPVRCVVRASYLGLVLGGAAIGLMAVLPAFPAILLLLVSGAAWVPGLLAADASLAPCAPDGGMARKSARRFPWFAAIMFCICGILGSMLYGISTELAWAAGQPTNPVVFGLAVAAVLAATTLLVLQGGQHMHLVWVPLFALLLASALLSCFSVPFANALAVGLLMASVFCYHFLRWMVFPALVGQSGTPHVLTCGLLLVLTNSFLNVSAGQALARILPETMRAQGGVVSIVLLLLVCCLAVSWVLERMQAPRRAGDAAREGRKPRSAASNGAGGRKSAEPGKEAPLRAEGAEPGKEALHAAMPPAPSEDAAEPRRDVESASDVLDARCAALSEAAGLTRREREIFALTARGYSSPFIAEKLVISDSTVRFHQRNIYSKLGVHSKQELIALANSES